MVNMTQDYNTIRVNAQDNGQQANASRTQTLFDFDPLLTAKSMQTSPNKINIRRPEKQYKKFKLHKTSLAKSAK